ncbi:MAG: sensor histidine kinase, partial [Marinirhabdus sp.]
QYYEKTNPKKALAYAEQTLQNATKINSQTAQLEALDYIVKLKTNPKEEALLYVEIDKKLTKLNRQNRELYSVTKFENEKLLKENLTLEADRLKKQKLNAWYLLGFIATVLLSVMVYIVLKNRHTKEKQQKVHETEARISKKIHDELANDVYSTMVQLENKSAKIPKIINELEEIYHKARDISQEKSVFKNNDEYVSDLKKMLGSFTSNDTNIIVQGLTSVIWIDIQEPKKVTTLRVLKELLVNMKKHSKATIVTILFLRVQNNLKITYIDDGIGMYKNLAINGSGLVNAENRIHAIDGKFTFDETITKGLKIKMNIPI